GQALEGPREALRMEVGFAMDRGDGVFARLEPQDGEDSRALARDGSQFEVRVRHDVADDLGSPAHPFLPEKISRTLVRSKEQRRDPIDLEAIVLLRHGGVAAFKPPP